jgi:hypothetical protein
MIHGMTVRLQLEPTAEVVDLAERLPIEAGWGVFEHRVGLMVCNTVRLRAVRISPEEAAAECERLDAVEGQISYETEGDPESQTLEQTTFSVAQVKLTGSEPEIIVRATYVLEEG